MVALLLATTSVMALVTTVVVPAGASTLPGGLTVGPDGNLYSADFANGVAYRVTPDGDVSVFARGLLRPTGNAFDSLGRYYQSNFEDPASPGGPDTITRINRKGIASTFATNLVGPVGIAIDAEDVLFVAMCNANQVWRVDQAGVGAPFATSAQSFACPNGLTFDDIGDLYVVSFNNGIVVRVEPDGTTTDAAVIPGGGNGHVAYVAGSLYVTDRVGNRIYEVVLPRRKGAPTVRLFAGAGVPSSLDGENLVATMRDPNGMARNAAGDTLYTNEFGGAIRAIELDLPRPRKPNRFKAVSMTDTSVELAWKDRDRREEQFRVLMAEGRKGKFEVVATLPRNSTAATIDGLRPETFYQLRVVAANGTSESRPSRRLKLTTDTAPGREMP